MDQLTREQAVEFFDSKAYESMDDRQKAEFQMEQDRLCMPMDVFQLALEKTLDRPVFTHELGMNRSGLKQELFLNAKPPSLEEVMNMIPEEKRFILTA